MASAAADAPPEEVENGDATPEAAGAPALAKSVFAIALEKGPAARDVNGTIVTAGFLDLCELILPVIDSFGTGFSIIRSDISGNIERLRNRLQSDPERFAKLYSIVEDELTRDANPDGGSCTKGLLWLKRALQFMVQILGQLMEKPEAKLSKVVYDVYYNTLYNYHGFIASSAFRVAFNFVPGREAFLDKVAGKKFDGQAKAELDKFVATFTGLLGEIHAFLDSKGQDDPTKV